jgi:hypothetical protein
MMMMINDFCFIYNAKTSLLATEFWHRCRWIAFQSRVRSIISLRRLIFVILLSRRKLAVHIDLFVSR